MSSQPVSVPRQSGRRKTKTKADIAKSQDGLVADIHRHEEIGIRQTGCDSIEPPMALVDNHLDELLEARHQHPG